MRQWITAIVLLAFVVPTASAGIFDLPDIDILDDIGVEIPGLDRAFREDPPITTSLADAYFGVESLDDFEPRLLASMHTLERAANGDFILARPGAFEVTLESYCLHAGTYGPRGGGDGYLFAPLKGPRAAVIEAILRGSMVHPDIPQTDVQSLVWGVLARTRISDMSGELQRAAQLFLTPEQISNLNGGALGEIPPELYDRVFGRLPDPVRRMFEAEAQVRSLLVSGVTDYAQLEQAAVLSGEPPEREGPITPEGRWSYHPDGYFIRFFPDGYSETRVQVSVPEPLQVERDGEGRVTLIADGAGNRVEAAYDDSIAPLEIGKDMRGFAFSQVRFVRRVVLPPELTLDWEATWDDLGMTLVGLPTRGKTKAQDGRYVNAAALYEAAEAHASELASLTAASQGRKPKKAKRAKLQGDPGEVMALAEFADGLALLLAQAPPEQAWAKDHLELVHRAWQGAFAEYIAAQTTGADTARLEGHRFAFIGSPTAALWAVAAGDSAQFGPGSGAAQPGNPDYQRLGLGNPKPDKKDCEAVKRERDMAQAVIDALNSVDPTAYNDLTAYQNALAAAATQIMQQRGLVSGNGTAHSPMAVSCMDPFPVVPGGAQNDPAYAADWQAYNSTLNWQQFANNWVKPTHFAGLPDIIFDAALAHELHHRSTLQNLPPGTNPCDWMGDPKNYKDEDIEAYKKQIQMLQDWLDKNC